MTALTQQPGPAVVEPNSILFQLCSRGDMLSSGATRNSGMEGAQSVMTMTTCEHQWDNRTGSDADHDVQDEPCNKHKWTDDKNTVSIYTELDKLIEPAINAAIGNGYFSPNRPTTR